MDENIPIENESRKKFEKTVKGIKKMLKSGKIDPVKTAEALDNIKKHSKKEKDSPVSKDRGVVYLGHIPHGFYEDQMESYFSQFGKVTNVRVARSAKTGRSKGFAFVEFLNKEVAEIVAQTMNNYLMDKRLIKAEYVPPEKQRPHYFQGKRWVPGKFCPGIIKRNKQVKSKNRVVTDEECIKDAKKRLLRLHKLKKTLRTAGIDYDFFQPCDIPEELKDFNPAAPNQPKNVKNKDDGKSVEKKEEKSESKNKQNKAEETKSKKKPEKETKTQVEVKKSKSKEKKVAEVISPGKKSNKKSDVKKSPKVLAVQTKTLEKKNKKVIRGKAFKKK